MSGSLKKCALQKIPKAKKLPIVTSYCPTLDKKIILDIQDQTKHPRFKEAMETLYLVIKTLVTNIIKMPFCSKKA